jgi:1-acyl-sn-glycerol-3-phosphate acyltransferase
LFPEGGIFDGAPRLKPFRNGAFKLAIKHEVKIVPITFLNNWKYLGDQNPLFGNGRPGISKVIIHPPVSTLGLDLNDVVPLRNECYEVIETPLRNRYPSRFRDSK